EGRSLVPERLPGLRKLPHRARAIGRAARAPSRLRLQPRGTPRRPLLQSEKLRLLLPGLRRHRRGLSRSRGHFLGEAVRRLPPAATAEGDGASAERNAHHGERATSQCWLALQTALAFGG